MKYDGCELNSINGFYFDSGTTYNSNIVYIKEDKTYIIFYKNGKWHISINTYGEDWTYFYSTSSSITSSFKRADNDQQSSLVLKKIKKGSLLSNYDFSDCPNDDPQNNKYYKIKVEGRAFWGSTPKISGYYYSTSKNSSSNDGTFYLDGDPTIILTIMIETGYYCFSWSKGDNGDENYDENVHDILLKKSNPNCATLNQGFIQTNKVNVWTNSKYKSPTTSILVSKVWKEQEPVQVPETKTCVKCGKMEEEGHDCVFEPLDISYSYNVTYNNVNYGYGNPDEWSATITTTKDSKIDGNGNRYWELDDTIDYGDNVHVWHTYFKVFKEISDQNWYVTFKLYDINEKLLGTTTIMLGSGYTPLRLSKRTSELYVYIDYQMASNSYDVDIDRLGDYGYPGGLPALFPEDW